MLGEYVIKILVLVFGYLYPAMESFKTIEMNRPDIPSLHFWCQYWVILAVLTAIERFGDIFISWLPLYGESKLAFIIFLWHPRTKGTSYVYESFLRPFMAQHETDIETRLHLIMTKSIELLVFYFRHFVDKGQSAAFEILQFILSRSSRSTSSEQNSGRPSSRRNERRPSPPPPPPTHPSAPPFQLPAQPPPFASRPGAATVPPPQPPPPSPGPMPGASYPAFREEYEPVNQVEEALRAAGVNLRRLRQQR